MATPVGGIRETVIPGETGLLCPPGDAAALADGIVWLLDNPGEAVVYEELNEDPQRFVLTLRGAFQRAGAPAVVRKMRKAGAMRQLRAGAREPRARGDRSPPAS